MNIAEKLTAKQPVSEATKRLNTDIFGAPVHVPGLVDVPTQRAIRQKVGPKLNKAETMALHQLQHDFTRQSFIPHGITLSLANGVRFTPDIVTDDGERITCYEVKAMRGKRVHIEDDSAVKTKCAAALYPSIKFWLMWYDRAKGAHQFQEVLP